MLEKMLITERLENFPSIYKEGVKKIKNKKGFSILNSDFVNYPTDPATGLAYKRFR